MIDKVALSSFTSCSEASTTVRRDAVIPVVCGSSAALPAAGNANHGGSVHAVSKGLTTFRSVFNNLDAPLSCGVQHM